LWNTLPTVFKKTEAKQVLLVTLESETYCTVDPQICKGPMSNHLNKSEVARIQPFPGLNGVANFI
jgi:hypothetical protein